MSVASQERAFVVLLAASGVALLAVLSPFLYVFVLAAVTASVLWPVHERLTALLGGRRWASGMLLISAIIVVLGVPMTWIGAYVISEGARGLEDLFWNISDSDGSWLLGLEYGYQIAQDELPEGMLPPVAEVRAEISATLRGAVLDVVGAAPAGVGGLLSSLWRLSVDLVVFAVALYLAFTRGPELLDGLRRGAPLREQYVSRLYEVFQQLAMNIVIGMVGTGIAQGVVAAVGFALAGVPAAGLLGAATAVTSMVPVVGSLVVWGPVATSLAISGHPGAAAFVVLWSLAATASADNVVKPYLLKNRLRVSPLWMLVVLFGGLLTMGVKGLVFGPLVLVLYLTLYTIYLRDFLGQGEAPAEP